jgi:DNA-binding CsgD family transcriptional regulator
MTAAEELRPKRAAAPRDCARGAAGALGLIGLPAAVVYAGRKLLAGNMLLTALVPDPVIIKRGEIVIADPAANALFFRALSQPPNMADGNFCSIPIRGNRDRPPMLLHLVRPDSNETDWVSAGSTLVVFTSILPPRKVPPPEVVQTLFNLSPAEARVACGIAERQTIEAIADDLGISRETVRCQLKSVLAKTGTVRQLDLALLLVGARIPKLIGARIPEPITQMGDAPG